MWIQHWSPRNPNKWAIWEDGPESYWAFTRNRGRIRNHTWRPYIAWMIGTSIYNSEVRNPIYSVEIAPGRQPDCHEIGGTAEEIDALWARIMHDPVSFMIRQVL
jgi:hypothetical protein